MTTPLEERVSKFCPWLRVQPDLSTGCWNWTGSKNGHGYGKFQRGWRTIPSHRYFYEAFSGPIPDGLQIDHLCRNRACCNPGHMEPVTIGENVRRGMSPGMEQRRKNGCANGHSYDETPPMVDARGFRKCRICNRLRNKRWRNA